jgi:hypothetical protein
MSGLRVEEQSKWGNATAYERYGKPQYLHGAPRPADKCYPQFPEDKAADRTYNDVPTSSWLRGGGESAEGKPGFDHSKGKRR